MSNDETPAERYRRLAGECLAVASTMPAGAGRTTLLEMAEVWQRLADQYADATPPFQSGAGEQPVTQQQHQVQPKDEDETF